MLQAAELILARLPNPFGVAEVKNAANTDERAAKLLITNFLERGVITLQGGLYYKKEK